MKSALHNYNMRYGIKTYVGRNQEEVKKAESNKDESNKRTLVVYVSHSFDENSFGLVSIVAKSQATTSLAMNVDQRYACNNSAFWEENIWTWSPKLTISRKEKKNASTTSQLKRDKPALQSLNALWRAGK